MTMMKVQTLHLPTGTCVVTIRVAPSVSLTVVLRSSLKTLLKIQKTTQCQRIRYEVLYEGFAIHIHKTLVSSS